MSLVLIAGAALSLTFASGTRGDTLAYYASTALSQANSLKAAAVFEIASTIVPPESDTFSITFSDPEVSFVGLEEEESPPAEEAPSSGEATPPPAEDTPLAE